MCTQHVWPTINQMLKAIDLDNKMVGLYTSLQSPNKPKVVSATDAHVMQQVDKLIASMGIIIPQQENTTLNHNSSFEGGAAGGGCTPAPEKSDELATKDNKIAMNETENSSFEGGAAGGGCPLAPEKDIEGQQITTFISPTGLINIRTNRDHDGEGGTA